MPTERPQSRHTFVAATSPEPVTIAVVGVLVREPVSLRLGRPSLLVGLEASTIDVSIEGERIVIDRAGCLVLPARTSVVLRSRSPSNRLVVLGFGDGLIEAVARQYGKLGLDRARLTRWLSHVHLLARTVWVHEVIHRYVFEREALGEHDNLATRFLEAEILKEVYFLLRDRAEGADRASAAQEHSPIVERAIVWIDAHLFEPCAIKALARQVGASESTLLRSFWRELGCRPSEYWRSRRLEESLVLLRAGRYTVAEVATRAGYNPTSFGHAFRRRFGRPPSDFLPDRPTRRPP